MPRTASSLRTLFQTLFKTNHPQAPAGSYELLPAMAVDVPGSEPTKSPEDFGPIPISAADADADSASGHAEAPGADSAAVGAGLHALEAKRVRWWSYFVTIDFWV